MNLEIYTDGGCSGNPGPGGWAYVIRKAASAPSAARGFTSDPPKLLAEKYGAERNTTNNRMELMAVIAALEALPAISLPSRLTVTLYTDSQYVQMGISTWIHSWKKNNWRTSGKEPVKNRDLWERLDALAAQYTVNWVWVKGHAGNPLNERCDQLTHKAIASLA